MKLTRVIFLALSFIVPVSMTSFASADDKQPTEEKAEKAPKKKGKKGKKDEKKDEKKEEAK